METLDWEVKVEIKGKKVFGLCSNNLLEVIADRKAIEQAKVILEDALSSCIFSPRNNLDRNLTQKINNIPSF